MKPKLLTIVCLIFILNGCSYTKSVFKANDMTSDIPDIQIPKIDINYDDFQSLSPRKIAWGLGRSLDKNGQPVDAVQANTQYGKYNASFVGNAEQKVYLTFDVGYENGHLSKILDTMKEKDAKGVFFITYQIAKENPDLVKRIIDEGHILGNHTYRHKSFPEVSLPTVTEEIMHLHNYVLEHYNYAMNVVRPPKGEFSEKTMALTQQLGYHTSLWSVAYYDWNEKDQASISSAKQKVMSLLHPGAVILLHSNSTTNTNMLGELIDDIRSKGYEISKFDLQEK